MRISVSLDIDAIVKQLPMREKIRLAEKLEQETWASRLDHLVSRIRSRASVKQISTQDLNRIVEDVRKARYARASRRS